MVAEDVEILELMLPKFLISYSSKTAIVPSALFTVYVKENIVTIVRKLFAKAQNNKL